MNRLSVATIETRNDSDIRELRPTEEEPRRGPSTLRDVARVAGVSIKTVSRVVNGEAHVTPATADKVRAAIDQLGYVPNIFARRLVQGRSFVIALLYEVGGWHWLRALQEGIAARCREAGYEVVLVPFHRQPLPSARAREEGLRVLKVVEQCNADGVVLLPPLGDDELFVSQLLDRGLPQVCVQPSQIDGPFISVRPTDRGGMTALTEYLLGLGHRRFGFVTGPMGQRSARDRLLGFRAALQAANVVIDDAAILEGDYEFASGILAGKRLLEQAEPPTAIIASNDEMAAGVLSVAYERGLRVPEQLSVAGFDDADIATRLSPPLTTVRQPLARLGEQAATLLLEAIDDRTRVAHLELPTELVVRRSTGPAPH